MYEERNELMDKVEELIRHFNKINKVYAETSDLEQKKILQFKVNFVKNVSEDTMFLIESDTQKNLCVRNGNLIIRNMVEQLIEFLYLLKHPELIKEYFGESISEPLPSDAVGLSKLLGKYRFKGTRKKIVDMAKDINQHKNESGGVTLYDIYTMLSETCHSSYFISWVEACEQARTSKREVSLSSLQIQLLQIIIGCVLVEC